MAELMPSGRDQPGRTRRHRLPAGRQSVNLNNSTPGARIIHLDGLTVFQTQPVTALLSSQHSGNYAA
jgi:hypothetical protein